MTTPSAAPRRFRARRGEKLGPGRKLVGRSTRFGNPFPLRTKIDLARPPRLVAHYAAKWGVAPAELCCDDPQDACARYRAALVAGRLDYSVDDVRRELAGFDLGCPCGLDPCHADTLLELANAPAGTALQPASD